MSISPEKKLETQEENIDQYKSDEPKNIQEQRSVGDPSTEIGTGINELTRTEFHNSGSAFRLNSSYNNILPNSFFPQSRLSIDEENSADMNPDDNIFEEDEYYNYPELLGQNFTMQWMSYEEIFEGIKSVLSSEKNNINGEKESMQNQVKNFEEFQKNFLKQKKLKKEYLQKLFMSGKFDINKNNNIKVKRINKIIENEKIAEIELNNGEIITQKLSILKKYPNSILSSYLNDKISCPKRNGHIFIDRDSQSFKNLLYYLENNKLPKFKNENEEKKFFDEMNYWKIPTKISSLNILRFKPEYCPYFFNLDKSLQLLTKLNMNHGIILLNKKLSFLTPYIEFSISLKNPNQSKKIFLALVDENKIQKSDINKSFEKNVPFAFLWDLFNDKVFKGNKKEYNSNEIRCLELNKFCRCYKNTLEIKYGLMYNQKDHTVELYRDDIKLNAIIQNIEPGLTPALEIHVQNCKIRLSSNNKYDEKFFL